MGGWAGGSEGGQGQGRAVGGQGSPHAQLQVGGQGSEGAAAAARPLLCSMWPLPPPSHAACFPTTTILKQITTYHTLLCLAHTLHPTPPPTPPLCSGWGMPIELDTAPSTVIIPTSPTTEVAGSSNTSTVSYGYGNPYNAATTTTTTTSGSGSASTSSSGGSTSLGLILGIVGGVVGVVLIGVLGEAGGCGSPPPACIAACGCRRGVELVAAAGRRLPCPAPPRPPPPRMAPSRRQRVDRSWPAP